MQVQLLILKQIENKQKEIFCCFLFGAFSYELGVLKNGSDQRENFASQVAKILNGVMGAENGSDQRENCASQVA